ncbi:MAG: CDP-glucose 4,6-dehydratase [Verrucomicrobiota bacterium]|jgi:CDP-glucose 4,6-dehydratase|nr:CDP-glucose 4,6-dehydratase [Verrucomicrobiota bacterium]
MFGKFYSGKTAWVTGHTGFKGAWLSLWLRDLGAQVHGLGLAPHAPPNLHETLMPGTFSNETIGDIGEFELVNQTIGDTKPEIVFHLAAQPLVRRSYDVPLETAITNILGTAHVLEALRQNEIDCPVVVVTSDKCYENDGSSRVFTEADSLGGHDVYSASKASAEIMTRSWRRAFKGRIATARAGNVIGGGDYGEDRIVPDCVRALEAGQPIAVRNPRATRPWQHVFDCLSGYLWLGARLADDDSFADAFNFGPEPKDQRPVCELVEHFLQHWPGEWSNDSEPNAPHEAAALSLAIDKVRHQLGWQPVWDFATALHRTACWYHQRHVVKVDDIHGMSLAQLEAFTSDAIRQDIVWTK